MQMLEMCERQRTHQASQANPSLSQSPHSGILSATLVPSLALLLLLHLLLLVSPLLPLLLLRFFLLFFYPNSTLTHRKMPIRNVSSEKEKLKLATIFFHAGSRCLPFSLSHCVSISVAPMLRHCFISFFAHFSLEMSRRAFMSCATLPTKRSGARGSRG